MNIQPIHAPVQHVSALCGLRGDNGPQCPGCAALVAALPQQINDGHRQRAAIERMADHCGVAPSELANVLLAILGDGITDIALAVMEGLSDE
jgi:hypothetical protein